jgi:hypothetical protein
MGERGGGGVKTIERAIPYLSGLKRMQAFFHTPLPRSCYNEGYPSSPRFFSNN